MSLVLTHPSLYAEEQLGARQVTAVKPCRVRSTSPQRRIMNTSSYLNQMQASIDRVDFLRELIEVRKIVIRKEIERQHAENLRVHPRQRARAQGQTLDYRIKEALSKDLVFEGYIEDQDLNIRLATMYATAHLAMRKPGR